MHESETVEETTPFDPSEPSTIGSQPQNVRMHGRRLGKETGAGIIEHVTAQGYDLPRPRTAGDARLLRSGIFRETPIWLRIRRIAMP